MNDTPTPGQVEGTRPPKDDPKADLDQFSAEELLDYAAGYLPDGWEIVIKVERGGGSVELVDANYNATDYFGGINDTIRDAIAECIERSRGMDGWGEPT